MIKEKEDIKTEVPKPVTKPPPRFGIFILYCIFGLIVFILFGPPIILIALWFGNSIIYSSYQGIWLELVAKYYIFLFSIPKKMLSFSKPSFSKPSFSKPSFSKFSFSKPEFIEDFGYWMGNKIEDFGYWMGNKIDDLKDEIEDRNPKVIGGMFLILLAVIAGITIPIVGNK